MGAHVVFVDHAPDALLLGESPQVPLHVALLEEVSRDGLLLVDRRDRVRLERPRNLGLRRVQERQRETSDLVTRSPAQEAHAGSTSWPLAESKFLFQDSTSCIKGELLRRVRGGAERRSWGTQGPGNIVGRDKPATHVSQARATNSIPFLCVGSLDGKLQAHTPTSQSHVAQGPQAAGEGEHSPCRDDGAWEFF